MTGERSKLHNEELNDLYCSPNIVRAVKSRGMSWTGHVAGKGDRRGFAAFWWGNLRERDNLGDRRRWEDNIKMDHQEVGCGGVDWIDLAQDMYRRWALVNAVMNFRVP